MHFQRVLFFLIIIYSFLLACNPTSHVPAGKYLLIKNEIKTDTDIIKKERFETLIKQKPNRKILGLFRFHLGMYNLGSNGDSTKFKKWLRSIGEEPVILDSELTNRTREQFNLFLKKNGFFNAVISDSVKFRKKKAVITYFIKYNVPYTIRNISYATLDTGIAPLIGFYQQNSLIVSGNRYDEDLLEKERERITTDLKDRGYYFFNRNFITFQIDSSLSTHQVDIFLYINRINENVSTSAQGTIPIIDHQVYKLRNIYVQTDYNPKDPSLSIPKDTTLFNGYYILNSSGYDVIMNHVLVRNLFIKPGDRYLQRDLDYTYKKLQELNVFKFINLFFKEVPRDSVQKDYLLDLQIQLTPMDKLDFTLESEATNTGGNIGIAGSFGFRNKNTFRGAEVLGIKLRGGLENVPNSNTSSQVTKFLFFNSYEIGPEISLSLKKILFLEKRTSRYSNPLTNFVLGYNHQVQPDYNRSVTNFAFSYSKNPTRNQFVIIYPLDINSVKVNLTPEFESYLQDLNDPRLLYTYETHIITSIRATWSTSSQPLPGVKKKDIVFFRTTGEVAYKAFNESLNPSQFIKGDVDFSLYHTVNSFNKLVYHITGGYGLPYGTSSALPFEKSFFAGGANSVRAWTTRTLGPGSYKSTVDIEQSGDIKIETNVEYRSELLEFANGMKLELATFVDAGNIWTINNDISRPGGKFYPKNAISELGIGAGAGTRFNFSFFILRLDFAVKLRDPSLDAGNRWVYPDQKFVIGDITTNLAIGYPF